MRCPYEDYKQVKSKLTFTTGESILSYFVRKRRKTSIAVWYNGSTSDFDSENTSSILVTAGNGRDDNHRLNPHISNYHIMPSHY